MLLLIINLFVKRNPSKLYQHIIKTWLSLLGLVMCNFDDYLVLWTPCRPVQYQGRCQGHSFSRIHKPTAERKWFWLAWQQETKNILKM